MPRSGTRFGAPGVASCSSDFLDVLTLKTSKKSLRVNLRWLQVFAVIS